MFELEGGLCCHIFVALWGDLKKEIPDEFILNRWTKEATHKLIFNDNGTLLEGCAIERNKA